MSLFARALPGFAALPPAIRAVHRPGESLALAGRADVERAGGVVPALLGALIGLPRSGHDVPVRVVIERRGDAEVWTRAFAGRRFRSVMSAGPHGLRERFGPLVFDLAVETGPEGLAMRIAGWSLGPLPLPARLGPKTEARESVDAAGRFRFDVALALPGIGRFARYRGWLVPEDG